MLLLVICGALALLSQVVSGRGRPREHDDDDADGVSNLQMLIPLLMEESEGERPPHTRPAPRYPDGPYSDIPAEAFFMEPSNIPEKHKTTKKQFAQFRAVAPLSGPGPSPASPPDAVVAGCVRYFQGGSAASSSSTEALLQLCTEVLRDARVEDVPHVHAEEPCAAQPPPRPRAEEPQALGSLLHALLDLLHAGGGGQSRRRWLIMNSNHPDQQMRQYVDVEM